MTLSIANPLNSVANHRAHFVAHLWKITREDNVQFRFTDHDTQIEYDDGTGVQTYSPAGSWSTSALRREEGLADQEADARGMLTSSEITYADLEAGLFREAEVVEFLIDPRFPWAGAFYTLRYWITDTSFDGEKWTAEIIGATAWLSQRTGRAMTRTCNADAFDGRCGIATTDETWYEVTAAIVKDNTQDADEPRRVFALTFASIPATGPEEDEYKHGKLLWTTGANAGIVSEVKIYGHTSTANQRDIELHLPTPYAIANADQCTLISGCNRTLSQCDTKFGNSINHRGHPTMPGTDDVLRTPNVPS